MRKLLILLSLASFAIAQEAADPPSRAARLSYINGTVSFQPGGVDDWVPAEANRPMTTGDRLWTEEGARVEMNLGSLAFRLSSRTNFTFVDLDDKTAQVQLSVGSLNVRLRRLAEDEAVEIANHHLQWHQHGQEPQHHIGATRWRSSGRLES